MARHTRGRVAPRRHARRAARAAPPRPGDAPPSCSTSTACSRRSSPQPDDAHMPETTRRPLIEVARALRHRRLRLRPPRLRRAPDRLARLDRLPGQPRLGDPAPRRDRAGGRPRAAGLDAARAGLHARGVLRGPAPAARPPRGQGGDRRAALARRARRGGRRAGDPRPSPRAPRPPGYKTHWGRKVLEIRPPVRIDKGAGIVSLLRDDDLDAAIYVGDDRTDLDAFRGLERARRHGPRADRDPHRRALRRGAAGARARGRRDGRRHGRRAARSSSRSSPAEARVRFVDFLKATVLLCAGAATLLAALTIVGGARDRRAGQHAGRRVLVGDRGRDRRADRPPPRDLAADRAAARRREDADRAARAAAGPDADQPALAAAGRHGRRGRALVLPPAGRRASRRASRSSGRSPGGARTRR